ncbi:MAG: hypothetical protein LBK50_01135 [Candidatus Nomurabacteria bacterium]|jgi:hypothetical protein|nr:hypothetical protein [Candidatus Nomurabacteria bacterium]
MKENAVIINGVLYDAATGLPVKRSPEPSPEELGKPRRGTPPPSKVQKSTTLNRKTTRDPVVTEPKLNKSVSPIHRSIKAVKPRSAPRPTVAKPITPKPKPTPPKKIDTGGIPTKHPLVTHFADIRPSGNLRLDFDDKEYEPEPAVATEIEPEPISPRPERPKPEPITDDESSPIDELVDDVITKTDREPLPDRTGARRLPYRKPNRRTVIIVCALLAALIIGLIAVTNLPKIEVMIASQSSSIPGKIPSYTVPGYKLKTPVVYSDTYIQLTYENPRQDEKYTVMQSKTESEDAPFSINGNTGTIIKKGITYNISHATLSNEQLRRIADSL